LDKTGVKSTDLKKKKKPIETTKARQIAKQAGKVIVIAMLICIIVGCIVVGAITLYVMIFVKPYPDINLSDAKLNFTSEVYANDPSTGNPIGIAQLSGDENRIWVDLKDTSKDPTDPKKSYLTNAIISTEDKGFYNNKGVDVKRTLSSFANMIFHFLPSNQGGSTITQQLVKNLEHNTEDRRIPIKIREIITALDLENNKKSGYSKDQILETYINTINLGNNCYGVQTASNMYFGKDVKDLDIAQCALLAGIIQSPNGDEPYKNVKKAEQRQQYVLKNMLNQNMITKDEYTAAAKEKLVFVPKVQAPRNWFVDQVITDVTNDLVAQKGYTVTYAQNLIYTQGLQIYTTENPKIQGIMDAIYTNDKYWTIKGDDGTPFQSSMLVADYSGRVVGMEGGRGAKTGNMWKNRATSTQFYRRPGSSFKPIATYSLALEKGFLNWSTQILDSPISLPSGKLWPRDDEASTNANMSVDYAITQSVNCVAVRVEQQVTSSASYNFLTSKLGFTSLTKTPDANGDADYTSLGIAIGSLQNGVNAEEMAGAYEIFGDGGVYNKPYTYTKVLDADGNVLLQNKPAAIRAITPATSEIMNHLLQNVVDKGTGAPAKLNNIVCPQVGKTGSSNDWTDRWFVGLTPEYVGAVWTGYDPPKNVGLSSTNPACVAWKAVFTQIEQGRDPAKNFPQSGSVIEENYDTNTGALSRTGGGVGYYNINDPAVLALQNTQISDTGE